MKLFLYCLSILSSLILLYGCGEKTKSSLINNATIHKNYDISEKYQSVFKKINEKFVECSGRAAFYMQRNIYPEIGEAELYMHGIDGSGYVFLITIKSNMDLMSKVDVYSKVSTGDFKQFIEIVKYAVDGNEGCPH